MIKDFLTLRFGRYVLVGALSAVVDVAIVSMALGIGVHYQMAVVLGFLGGLLVNYVLHARFTFSGGRLLSKQGVRFLSLVSLNLLITVALVALFHEIFGLEVVSSKVLSLPIVAATGYILSKRWVFV